TLPLRKDMVCVGKSDRPVITPASYLREDEKGPVERCHSTGPIMQVVVLLSFRFHHLFLGCRLRMIRNRLYGVLIYRLRSFPGERSTRRNDPVVSRLGSARAGPGFDSAGVNPLLRFATREIELRIHGAFSRQILPFLARIGVAD